MISAVVLTKNEEGLLEACLQSVKWVDEIIVVDDGSVDNTLKVADRYTDKIFTFKDQDFAKRRNFAVSKTSGDWILFIDADERVLKSLKEELQQMIQREDVSVLAISRRNIILGLEQNYGPFWPDWVIRLIRKENFLGYEGSIHEQPKFKGKLEYSKHSLIHLTHRGVDQIVLKSLNWSRIDAKLRFDSNHPKMTGWRFLRILLSEMFNQGIKRRGFFSGTIGVIDSLLQVFSLYISYVRLWEMQQSRPLERVYKDIDEKLRKNNFEY